MLIHSHITWNKFCQFNYWIQQYSSNTYSNYNTNNACFSYKATPNYNKYVGILMLNTTYNGISFNYFILPTLFLDYLQNVFFQISLQYILYNNYNR